MADVITRFKVESSEYERKIKSAKGQLGEFEKGVGGLTRALGINMSALTKLGATVSAITTAMKVAKDAFFASEKNIDDWGRTVRSAQDVYQGFLTSLNTGDISGYLSRIDQIVDAAKEAYNELDRLSTQKAINNKKVQAQNAENQRMQMMLRTGRYIAPTDGQKSVMAEGTVLSQQQLKNIEKHYKAGLAKSEAFINEDISQINKSISAMYTEQAKRLGMSRKEFLAGTEDMTAFDSKMAGAAQYNQWRREHVGSSEKNPFSQYAGWAAFKDDGDLFKQINDLINERAGLQSQHYSNMGRAYRTMNRIDNAAGGTGGGGGGTVATPAAQGSIDWYNEQITSLNKQLTAATDQEVRVNIQNMIDEYTAAIAQIKSQVNLTQVSSRFNSVKGGLDEWGKTNGNAPIANSIDTSGSAFSMKLNVSSEDILKTIENQKKALEEQSISFKDVGKEMMGGISQVASGLQEMGINLGDGFTKVLNVVSGMFTVLQGVETIVNVINMIKSVKDTAYQASMLALMTTLTAEMTAKTVPIIGTLLAGGGKIPRAANGLIPGNHFSGDNLIAVNSGEYVFNRAQMGNLASQLGGGTLGDLELHTILHGEDIDICLSRNKKRRRR